MEKDGNGEIPEFKPKYIKAFLGLLLFKTGGKETITVEQLEKFPDTEEALIIDWDPDKKAFSIEIRGYEPPKAILTPKKILKKMGVKNKGGKIIRF